MRDTLFSREMLPVLIGSAILMLPAFPDVFRTKSLRPLLLLCAQSFFLSGLFTAILMLMLRGFAAEGSPYSSFETCIRPLLWGALFALPFRVMQKGTKKAPPKDTYGKEVSAPSSLAHPSGDNAYDTAQFLRDHGLTPREKEIALLVSRRLTNREIGETLFISEATVKKHVSHIFAKLNVSSREELRDLLKPHDITF